MATKISHKVFHSKILLFGEHIINKGAMGLAIPVEHFDGLLKLGDLNNKKVEQSNQSLESLAHHIVHTFELSGLYDTNSFLEDIENGLYFDSTIPQGYGLGSSGALVAAVYHQYRKNKKKKVDVSEVKHELAALESYFHGTSSGLDPIVCYLNKAVLLKGSEVTKTFDLPVNDNPQLKLFLVNTKAPRSTSLFVNLFLEKCNDEKFMQVIDRSLIPATNIAIQSFLNRSYSELLKSVKLISQLQLDMLPEFIPNAYKKVWNEGLKHNEFSLKICGAGGGGFIIGFAQADTDLRHLLGEHEVIELLKF